MHGLQFEDPAQVDFVAPNRADVACFVGFITRRSDALPARVAAWLRREGWVSSLVRQGALAEDADGSSIPVDVAVPVPVESWDQFSALFAWDERPLDAVGHLAPTWLGLAVRAFFANGGRRCFIVCAGTPWTYEAVSRTAAWRAEMLDLLFPHAASGGPSPVDRTTWTGVGQLLGLPEVSFVSLPDLADLLAPTITDPPEPFVEEPSSVEEWVICDPTPTVPDPGAETALRAVIPRLDGRRLSQWRDFLRALSSWISRQRREVQLVASLPPLHPGTLVSGDLHTTLTTGNTDDDADSDVLEDSAPPPGQALLTPRWLGSIGGIASAHVQLVWPWLHTEAALSAPGAAEPGEGTLIGMLARNALVRGTFRSAAGTRLTDVADLTPLPDHATLSSARPVLLEADVEGDAAMLRERVSVFAPSPQGLVLLSDVTTSPDVAYRPAAINRLVAAVVRTARRAGQDAVFENNGPETWSRVQRRVADVLAGFFEEGALAGATRAAAFQVRCDRTTMSANDIDNGRLIVQVRFQPAAPIDTIVVELNLTDGTRPTRDVAA